MGVGYLFLLLQVAGSVSFGHVMKWSGRLGCNLTAVAAINYFFAAALSLLFTLQSPPANLSSELIVPGAIGGLSYAVSFFFYYEAIRLLGVSVSTTTMRIGVIPAVLASVFYWHETLSPLQLGGLVLSVSALPLLSFHPRDKSSKVQGPTWLWLLALFISAAGFPLASKAFAMANGPEAKPTVMTVWFATAALVSGAAFARQRKWPRPRDWVPGLLLGAVNVVVNYSLLSALGALPGAVVFPVASAGGVLVATVSSALIWRERLGRAVLIGVGLSMLALVLINS